MDDKALRSGLIRLAHEHPEHREKILPVLKAAAPPSTLPPELAKAKLELAKAEDAKEMAEGTAAWAVRFQKLHEKTAPEYTNRANLAQIETTRLQHQEAVREWSRAQDAYNRLLKRYKVDPAKLVPQKGPDGKIPVDTGDIRKGYYGMTDGYGRMKGAIRHSLTTMDDKGLQAAVENVDKAIRALNEALKPYAWD